MSVADSVADSSIAGPAIVRKYHSLSFERFCTFDMFQDERVGQGANLALDDDDSVSDFDEGSDTDDEAQEMETVS